MTSDGDPAAYLDVLTERIDVLRRLAAAPAHKPDVVADLDHSRSTVDRAVRRLEAANLVERGQAGFAATVAGRLALERLEAFEADLADLVETEPVLAPLPADAPIAADAVVGAERILAEEAAPYRPVERFHQEIEAADRYRAVLPAIDDPRHVEVLYDHVLARDRPAELVVSPDLFETLRTDFPRRIAAMADAEGFRLLVGEDLPPFGLSVVETDDDSNRTVAVVVYAGEGSVHGLVVNDSREAVRWAEERFETHRSRATDRTDALAGSGPHDRAGEEGDGPGTAPVGRSLPVSLERAGFVELDRSYFREEPVADPTTAWRAGLSLVEVHTGYAVDRVREDSAGPGEDRATMASSVQSKLAGGTTAVVVGPPGSGKSNVCKRVACEWYREDRGPVIYREGGRGRPFDAPEDLLAAVEAAEGHALVVVEDAVRPDADAVFEAIDRVDDDAPVSFLLDARESEWTDPPGSIGVDTGEFAVEPMPALADGDVRRIVDHFETTVGEAVDVPLQRLRSDVRAETAREEVASGGVVLLLHRLATYADPLADERTSLEDAATALYDEVADDDLALSVCVLANALNAAGIEVEPGLLYAVADPNEYGAVDAALDHLEGRVLFPRGDGSYRTVHETWSVTFLGHLLEAAGPEAAARRFGDAVSHLLALADDPGRRERIADHLDEEWDPVLREDPGGWAGETVEAVYALGRKRPKVAPLFGDGETHSVRLPETRPDGIADRRWVWTGRMFVDAGHYDRAAAAVDRGLAAVAADSRLACRLLGLRADVLTFRREMDEARTVAERQRDLATDLDARDLEVEALRQLARVAYERDDHDRARELREEALPIAESLGDREAEGHLRKELGNTATMFGEIETAREHLQASLRIARERGDRQLAASCLGNLAGVARRRRQWDRAREYLTETLETFRALGDRRREAKALVNLAHVARDRSDYPAAREYAEECLDLVEAIDDPYLEARAYVNIAHVALGEGDYETSREHFETALGIAREHEDPAGEADGHLGIADAGRLAGSEAVAREHYETALEIARAAEAFGREILALIGLAAIARDRGDFEAAREYVDGAIEASTDRGSEMGRIRLAEARLALARGDHDAARERASEAREIFTSMGGTHRAARCRRVLGRAMAAQGDHDVARDHFEAALETFEELGTPQDALRTLEALWDRCRERGDAEAAERWRQRAADVAADAPEAAVEAHGEWIDEAPAVETDD